VRGRGGAGQGRSKTDATQAIARVRTLRSASEFFTVPASRPNCGPGNWLTWLGFILLALRLL